MIICFYSTITQNASVNLNINVTGNFEWNVIIDIADYMLIIWPICQDYFITSIQYCRSNISPIELEVKITITFNNVSC